MQAIDKSNYRASINSEFNNPTKGVHMSSMTVFKRRDKCGNVFYNTVICDETQKGKNAKIVSMTQGPSNQDAR
jgi:hypothetical protein